MSRIIKLISALVLSTSVVIAQEQTDDENLALGEPVQPEEIPFTSEKVGDWELQCATAGPEPRPCQMYQLLTDGSGQAVAEITLFKVSGAGPAVAGANILVPLETLLTAQLAISIDGKNQKRYPYRTCTNLGCLASIGLTEEDIDAYKKGGKGIVTLVPAAAPDRVVMLEMSLVGFTQSYDNAGALQ